jgi:hypothetical protein
MKHTFLQDDDCHWYLVPDDKVALFHMLQDYAQADDYAAFNNTFEQYRCEHPSCYSVEIERN